MITFQKNTIAEIIEKEELSLLSSKNENSEWLKRWKEYIQGNQNIWNLKNYVNKAERESDIPQSFKDACRIKSKKKTKDNKTDIYEQVSKLCTKSFTISSLIEKNKKISLITANTGDEKWNKAWKRYLESNKNELGFENWTRLKSSHPVIAPSDYKTKCDTKKVKEVKNSNDKDYLAVMNWCTE